MKAVVVSKHGAPEVLKIEEREKPVAGTGEVVIAVRSAGVNFADVLARLGVYDAAPPPPFIPGIEVAGTIEEAGPGVENVAPGDRVMAFCPFAIYSSHGKIRTENESRLFRQKKRVFRKELFPPSGPCRSQQV